MGGAGLQLRGPPGTLVPLTKPQPDCGELHADGKAWRRGPALPGHHVQPSVWQSKGLQGHGWAEGAGLCAQRGWWGGQKGAASEQTHMILTLTPFQNVFHWIIISQKGRERQAALSLTHMELSWNGRRCSEPLMAAGQRERWRGLALGSPYLHGDSKYLIENWVDGGDETVKTRGQWESEGWSLREDLSLLGRARRGSKQEILYYHPHSVDGETEAGGVTPRLPTSPSTQTPQLTALYSELSAHSLSAHGLPTQPEHWARSPKPSSWPTLASAPSSISPIQCWVRAARSQWLFSQEGWEPSGPSLVFWTEVPSAF